MPEINLTTGEITESAHMMARAISPDSKQPIPDNPRLSGSNGVQLPGPDSAHFETGFDPTGSDMSGISGYRGGDSMQFADQNGDGLDHSGPSAAGRTREGDGRGTDGDSRDGNEPPTNQKFGVASDSGNLGLGDMAANMHIFGTAGSNTEAVRSADIVRVFDAIARGGSGGGHDGGAVSLPGRAMEGIPLAAGSGVLMFDTASGDPDKDGY